MWTDNGMLSLSDSGKKNRNTTANVKKKECLPNVRNVLILTNSCMTNKAT